MKKFIYNVVMLVALTAATSCNSILDVDSSDYVLERDSYYQTETDLDYALNGIYATLAEGYLYGNYMLGRMGLEADEAYEDYAADEYTAGDYNVESTDARVRYYWRQCYAGIDRANTLLMHVDNPKISIDAARRADIKGQALFLRGYYYLLLVTRFQGVPLILEPLKSAGIDDLQQPRASGREIYRQIVQDMEMAAEMVRSAADVGTGGRISKSAVWGVLARVNLYLAGHPYNERERYMDAMIYAGKVIGTGIHALNPSYEQIFINYAQDKYDIRESIFEVEFHSDGIGLYPTMGQVGAHNGIRNTVTGDDIGFSIGLLRATSYLYLLYSDGDVRRDWNISPFEYVRQGGETVKQYFSATVNNRRYPGKFRRENELLSPKTTGGTTQNFPLLRYSDVLLMYAEAYNEYYVGADDSALECLNMVRRRGFGLDPNVPHAVDFNDRNYGAFRDEVRAERPRELCFEAHRKNDVIRWGIFYDNMVVRGAELPQTSTAVYYVRGRRYFESVDRKDEWWPIPAYEMGLNKKLVQNEGW